jgi:hypothetical protein
LLVDHRSGCSRNVVMIILAIFSNVWQASRRSIEDSGMREDASGGNELKPAIRIPMEADFLYVYSTADGRSLIQRVPPSCLLNLNELV